MWTALKETDGLANWVPYPELRSAIPLQPDNCPEESEPMMRISRDTTGFLCVRGKGHPGRHIAFGLDGIMAAWPGDHRPTVEDLT